MLTNRRILLLSAYDAASHQQWRQTLCSMFTQCHWTCLTLPARYFSWRVRGNSLSWAFNHRRELTDNHDLVIATSLTDLASLRGFVPELAQIPTLLYFHENQFAYPIGDHQNSSVEPAMVNLYSALCADHIAFNSEWNRRSFLQGADALLTKLPDHVPPGLITLLREKSSVLPVPLPNQLFVPQPDTDIQLMQSSGCVEIVWNHRHEYDKGPDLLLAIVEQLVQRNLRFRLHLLGQRFRKRPEVFEQIEAVLVTYYRESRIEPGVSAFVSDRQSYERILRQSDIVLSTALHDFQGLSMLEAAALGCYPIAPDALAYPEYLPVEGLYAVSGLDLDAQAAGASDLIIKRASHTEVSDTRLPNNTIAELSANKMATRWQQTLVALLKS